MSATDLNTTSIALERKEVPVSVTVPASGLVLGRQEGGAPDPITSTPMKIILSSIPVHQPSGRLSVPPDDAAHLRAAVERAGGRLDFEETTLRGFIYGGYNGLPVYRLEIQLPDDADAAAAMKEIDPVVKALIDRNLAPERRTQPA